MDYETLVFRLSTNYSNLVTWIVGKYILLNFDSVKDGVQISISRRLNSYNYEPKELKDTLTTFIQMCKSFNVVQKQYSFKELFDVYYVVGSTYPNLAFWIFSSYINLNPYNQTNFLYKHKFNDAAYFKDPLKMKYILEIVINICYNIQC